MRLVVEEHSDSTGSALAGYLCRALIPLVRRDVLVDALVSSML